MSSNYHEQIRREEIKTLRGLVSELPPPIEEFMLGISESTSVRTRVGYARDLKIFFAFLSEPGRKLAGLSMGDISLEHIAILDAMDIRRYLEYVTYYTRKVSTTGSKEIELEAYNESRAKQRKLSAVRRMFEYFYKNEKILSNPAELVDTPKIKGKNITYLQSDEVAKLLDEVESGAQLDGRRRIYHAINRLRDVAIITLFLGTGVRISELVGINLEHIDMDTSGISIMRKGGKEDVVYFGDEVRRALEAYIEKRGTIEPLEGNEGALFLSTQRRRITTRAVQNLVKKYAKLVSPLKNISPHKLRSTYGTALYNETGDIYLVAEVLGHADINTTKKHYANMPFDKKRKAADAVKLRDN